MGISSQSVEFDIRNGKQDKIVGITFSTFNFLHAGHVQMLAEAKRQCDYLICGLQMDPSVDHQSNNKPTQSLVERYIQLRGCQYVDEIVPYATERDLEDILQAFKIDVRILGDEYKDKNFTGRSYCEDTNIKLYFNSRDHRFSGAGLPENISESESKSIIAIGKAEENRSKKSVK